MTLLRCNVCGRRMDYVKNYMPSGWSWRCPNEGFLRHFEKERAA